MKEGTHIVGRWLGDTVDTLIRMREDDYHFFGLQTVWGPLLLDPIINKRKQQALEGLILTTKGTIDPAKIRVRSIL